MIKPASMRTHSAQMFPEIYLNINISQTPWFEGVFNRAPFTKWTPVSVDILVLVLLFSNIIAIDFPCRRGRYWNRKSRQFVSMSQPKSGAINQEDTDLSVCYFTCFSCFILRLRSPDTHNSLLISSELKSLSVRKLRPFKLTGGQEAAAVLKSDTRDDEMHADMNSWTHFGVSYPNPRFQLWRNGLRSLKTRLLTDNSSGDIAVQSSRS